MSTSRVPAERSRARSAEKPSRRRGLFLFSIGVLANLLGPQVEAEPADRVVESLLERRQRHVVMQQWDLSCGAAALATILNFQHGDSITEREIAIGMMGRTEYLANPELVNLRQGFSLLDMKNFVDGRGYNGIGLGQLSVDDLQQLAPIIVPLDSHGYQHFVVFRGMIGDRVLLADPAFGNRTIGLDRFENDWLELSELGHVGFYVERTDGLIPPNLLRPRSDEISSAR